MINIAVPNKGRMYKPTMELLKNAGFEPKDFDERKLSVETCYPGLNIIFLRTDDIGPYVESKVADIGITGLDIVSEMGLDVDNLLDLNYGHCKLVLAGPKREDIRNGVRVATKFENLARQYFENKNIKIELINSLGATEIKPQLGLADFIVDITSTGSTIKNNGLEIFDVLLRSNAILIANKNSLKEKEKEIETVKMAIESVLLAENKSYMMFNIRKNTLDRIIEEIPCMRAPTIGRTGDDSVVSVHTVVPTDRVSETIIQLKGYEATDILVMDIKRVIL